MSFKLRHPVGLTTNTFDAERDHDIEKSGEERIESANGHMMRDFTLYKYTFAPAGWKYIRGLSGLSVAKQAALEAFFTATGGEPFDFTDEACGPVTTWVSVNLMPESYVRPYEYQSGGKIGVTFSMMTVP